MYIQSLNATDAGGAADAAICASRSEDGRGGGFTARGGAGGLLHQGHTPLVRPSSHTMGL